MNTMFLLMARHDGQPVIPLDVVCKDYFQHLTPDEFSRKATKGQIDLPVVRIETSAKAAKGIHIADLARWIDERHAAARKECDQLQGRR